MDHHGQDGGGQDRPGRADVEDGPEPHPRAVGGYGDVVTRAEPGVYRIYLQGEDAAGEEQRGAAQDGAGALESRARHAAAVLPAVTTSTTRRGLVARCLLSKQHLLVPVGSDRLLGLVCIVAGVAVRFIRGRLARIHPGWRRGVYAGEKERWREIHTEWLGIRDKRKHEGENGVPLLSARKSVDPRFTRARNTRSSACRDYILGK